MLDTANIKALLCARVLDLCQTLLPNGRRTGHEWCVGGVEGEPGASMKVQLTGSKAGVWQDFSGNDKGDVLALIQQTQGVTFIEALKWAADFLGIQHQAMPQPVAEAVFNRPSCKGLVPALSVPEVELYLTETRGFLPSIVERYKLMTTPEPESFQVGGQWLKSYPVIFPFIDGPGGKSVAMLKSLAVNRPVDDKGKPQRMMRIAPAGAKPTLFGWQCIKPEDRYVILSEGECNAIAWQHYGHPALALPYGAGAGKKQKWIECEYDRLQQFETIYINCDADEPGQAAVEEVGRRLGLHRIRVLNFHDLKDANDALRAGYSIGQMEAVLAAAGETKPSELVPIQRYAEDAINAFYPPNDTPVGYSFPWSSIRNQIRLRPSELSLVAGYTSNGKSEMLGQSLLDWKTQGARTCLASFEMAGGELVKRMVRQASGLSLPSREQIKDYVDQMDGIYLYDRAASNQLDRLLEVFEYAVRRYGVDICILDSLMKLGLAFDDWTGQATVVHRLQQFAYAMQCHVILVHHFRGGDDSQPGGLQNIKGNKAMMDLTENVFTLWRNKAKERLTSELERGIYTGRKSPEEIHSEPDAIFSCDKQRNGDGEIPQLALYFDRASRTFREDRAALPQAVFHSLNYSLPPVAELGGVDWLKL